jgi:hypothetical protein
MDGEGLKNTLMVFNQNQLQTSTTMDGWWRPCKLGHRKVQGGYGRCTCDLRGLLRSSLFLRVKCFLAFLCL